MFTVRASDFNFQLPTPLIAQCPCKERDESRLLVLRRSNGAVSHHCFRDLPQFLRAGDLLVLNDSKVIPARLRGKNHRSGGEFEMLLLEENSRNDWWAMVRPGKRARAQTRIDLKTRDGKISGISATVIDVNSEGHRRLVFDGCENIFDELAQLGEVPLPPYIKRDSPHDSSADLERYQTIYAQAPGSVAAPTAGLHFTPAVMSALQRAGVQMGHVTLHVGPGTFAPVKSEELSEHVMHDERYVVPETTAALVNAAKAEGRRVIAIGTTSVRVLESAVGADVSRLKLPVDPPPTSAEEQSLLTSAPTIQAHAGRTKIFLHPPAQFRVVDALLTNFHLPRSTLLMLVSAFAAPGDTRGRDLVLRAYEEAIAQRYRFFSYGDAMFIE